MRVEAVTVSNIGGLADGRVDLPGYATLALAGANGTGKSKLLACILSPWSSEMPSPRQGEVAEVRVQMRLSLQERQALTQLSAALNWGPAEVPEVVEVGLRHDPFAGLTRISNPPVPVLQYFANYPEFMARNPSLNVIYLPAERRLLAPRQQGIDLNQLSAVIALEKNAEARSAIGNYGRLDDQEFEDFAKALCVAATLPSEEGESETFGAGVRWDTLQETVNDLLSPKHLMPLTKSYPDQLRIRTASGDMHAVRDLSSGERQALIIISRVLRLGSETPLVIIDEPDAYLHPHLSKRLILALEKGVGVAGQLIVATHSPAVLDGVPPSSILRLEHGAPPRVVADESERLELYRAAGFRSSALTQSSLLLLTEGTSDIVLLGLALPQLSSAAMRPAGGKQKVLREVEQLKPFDLPVLGIIDRDVNEAAILDTSAPDIFVWPTADIEGLYLSPESLAAMIELRLLRSPFASVDAATQLVHDLCIAQRDNVIAEVARDRAVAMSGYEWPSPRGLSPLDRLRDAVSTARPISAVQLDEEIARAESMWDESNDDLLKLVRGKYILAEFNNAASEMKSGRALIEAVARARPPIPAIGELGELIDSRLGRDA